ncbi:LysR substrate-binding domain-containing protein [Actinomadura coerulea]|uniref:LysR substrate-binding domain-containing protein n=1 Tax=Actinomadura coerulea TaxID=46159 RepID=UPI0034168053
MDLPGALKDFHVRHPQVRVTLRLGGSADLAERVREGTMDVAFLGLPRSARPKGVHGRVLAHGELVAVVAPGHPLADAVDVGLRRLSEEVFVDFSAGTAGRAQSDEAFAAAGVGRDVAFEVTTPDLVVRLVRLGLGIGMLPAAFVTGLTDLRVVELRDPPTRVEHMVWSRLGPSPAAAAFMEGLDVPAAPEPPRGATPETPPAEKRGARPDTGP